MIQRNPYRGKYVVFEGIDGSGKDTQISLLEPRLLRSEVKYVRTSEPTTFLPTGLLIKALLRGNYNFDPRTTVLLFLADSHEHLRLRVIPNLRIGRWVISSRSFISTLAYHTVLGIEKEFLQNVMDRLDFLMPDVVILLDIDAKTSLSRKGKEKVKQIYEEVEFLERVRKAYLNLVKDFNFVVVDGKGDPFDVAEEVWEVIRTHIP